MSKYTLTIINDPNSEFTYLNFHYNKPFQEWLKYSLRPASCRYWDPKARQWRVLLSSIPYLVLRASRFFGDVHYSSLPEEIICQIEAEESYEREFKATKNTTAVTDPYSVLYLLQGAPFELVRIAYKVLAKKWHPDVPNGDSDKFKKITNAYQIIKNQYENTQ